MYAYNGCIKFDNSFFRIRYCQDKIWVENFKKSIYTRKNSMAVRSSPGQLVMYIFHSVKLEQDLINKSRCLVSYAASK